MASEIAPDDASFRHYSTKQKWVAWVSQHLFDHVTYTARRGLVKGMKRKGGLGWLPEFLDRSTETAEHKFLMSLNLANRVVFDVGAFQGMLTLFFTKSARQVVCYEPNVKNRARLRENLVLNNLSNVVVRPVGAGAKKGSATMVSSALAPGGATVDQTIAEAVLQSNTTIATETIEIVALDQDIIDMSLAPPDFVKLDIEGEELAALVGLADTLEHHAPAIFLEMHGETMHQKRTNASDIVKYLVQMGYRVFHVETDTELRGDNSSIGARGHLYAFSNKDVRSNPPRPSLT